MNIEDKRLHPRYPVSWPGNIVVNFKTFDIHIGNVCRQGLWFESSIPLTIGERYSVELHLPTEEENQTVRAFLEVVYQTKNQQNSYEIGASLSLILPEDKPAFERVIDRFSEENEQRSAS